jgi:hypothetical protein
MDFSGPGFEQDEHGAFLRFDDKAQIVFDDWYAELMTKLEGDEHPVLLEHMGKYRSLMPSLALIFHLVEVADGVAQVSPVSEHCAIQAAAWCEYLESHARRIYGMVINGGGMAAAALARKIRERKLESPFKVRTIQQRGWGLLTDNVKIRESVDRLLDAYWIREVPQEKKTTGRPSDVEYEINPKIFRNA